MSASAGFLTKTCPHSRTAKGYDRDRILLRHVARNAAIPIVTTLGVSLRFSLSSLPVVELFFGWPGAGYMLIKAIASGDNNLALAFLLCFGVLFILTNIGLELAYSLLNPRIRAWPRQAENNESRVSPGWAGLARHWARPCWRRSRPRGGGHGRSPSWPPSHPRPGAAAGSRSAMPAVHPAQDGTGTGAAGGMACSGAASCCWLA